MSTKKLIITMAPDSYELLIAIKKRCGLDSLWDVINHSVNCYEFLLKDFANKDGVIELRQGKKRVYVALYDKRGSIE